MYIALTIENLNFSSQQRWLSGALTVVHCIANLDFFLSAEMWFVNPRSESRFSRLNSWAATPEVISQSLKRTQRDGERNSASGLRSMLLKYLLSEDLLASSFARLSLYFLSHPGIPGPIYGSESLLKSLTETFCRLNWCDELMWWRYQLNTNW